MPIITFFQTKGGTGKTTSAFALAELLSWTQSVTVIDADPNQPFATWKNDGGEGEKFKIVTEPDNEKIPDAIIEAAAKSTFVVVDTEGSANETAALAAAMSDLVIVTTMGSPLDQKAAAKAIKFVKSQEQKAGREIPVWVLMTRQKAIAQSRTIKKAIETMRDHGINVFNTQMIERDAFAAFFGYCTTLNNLDPKLVPAPIKAYHNIRLLRDEIVRIIAPSTDQAEEVQKTSSDKEAA